MPNRRKPEFSLTPELEQFKYEVAEEIALDLKKGPQSTTNDLKKTGE
ncbi:MAG TPA: small, acid-soluble spore protein, alpha/beta type [Desulfobacteria bacterium]|nr:small, acid-soluble spore protein, alpha/beta type [Desulfobacteria bacterium]